MRRRIVRLRFELTTVKRIAPVEIVVIALHRARARLKIPCCRPHERRARDAAATADSAEERGKLAGWVVRDRLDVATSLAPKRVQLR
jgi:hypothetical protein